VEAHHHLHHQHSCSYNNNNDDDNSPSNRVPSNHPITFRSAFDLAAASAAVSIIGFIASN
jgi:hypothetical protein